MSVVVAVFVVAMFGMLLGYLTLWAWLDGSRRGLPARIEKLEGQIDRLARDLAQTRALLDVATGDRQRLTSVDDEAAVAVS